MTPDTTPASEPPKRRRLPRHWAIWAAVLCMLFGAGFLLSQRSSSSGTGGKGKKGGKGGGGPIPISVGKVTKGNMPVYINSLGTVTSVYTVAVASRVTGALTEID